MISKTFNVSTEGKLRTPIPIIFATNWKWFTTPDKTALIELDEQSVFQWKRYHTRQRRSNRHSQLYYSRQAFTLHVPANLLMVSVKDSHGMMMIESCKQSIPFPQPATTLWTNTEYYLTGSIEMLQEQFIQGGLALFATDL